MESIRVCKKCGVEKDFSYLTLNTQGRSVYKDDDNGSLWHGRVCYPCFKDYVKSKSGKEALADRVCHCGQVFRQKSVKQAVCCKKCYSSLKKSVTSL